MVLVKDTRGKAIAILGEVDDIDCFVYRLHWRKEAMGKI